uniref:N(G),N(G)-dimethylarginine dimethylaminohydrolase 1-like n=1 Tax=Styela clava TaxID=7725 RepID=UPI00193A1777|nr:N(G),N(G)-dimethylarginine dimethylaminohydrolase 1-like [Styela clava]
MDEYFKYNTAIVRKVAKSLPEEAQRQSPESTPVDWENTIKQHDNYVNILRNEIGLKVVELPADEELPDCVFVEDVAVVIGNKALVTTPGHKSRQGETDAMRKCLHDLGLNLTIMKDMDSEALLDGGDVLFTGQEIMVGVSSRTNRAACTVLAQTFQNSSNTD